MLKKLATLTFLALAAMATLTACGGAAEEPASEQPAQAPGQTESAL